jgi:8-oxo-dGTP pyrophosphatase MutT (NUDIX family)
VSGVPLEHRRAARLVIRDEAGRVLLFRHARPDGTTFWATPGGGLEPDESFDAAAVRELREETGLVRASLAPLGDLHREFPWGARVIRQHERWYTARLEPGEAIVPPTGEPAALENVLDVRWWTLDALRAAGAGLVPHDLADRLAPWGDRIDRL